MAASAPSNINRPRRAAAAAPGFARPTTASEVSIASMGPGVETALGYFTDPSMPVVQGIGAGGAGGIAIMGVGLFLMRSAMPPGALDAVAPIVLLLGFLLGGMTGGLGGLLVLLAGQRVRPSASEPPGAAPALPA